MEGMEGIILTASGVIFATIVMLFLTRAPKKPHVPTKASPRDGD